MNTYTTVQGDTWDLIAHQQLGSANYTDQLIRANPEYIGTIFFSAGITLRLPDITEDNTADSLPPWKR